VDSLGTDFDALLTRGALALLVLAGCWALVVVVVVALEARTGGRVRLAERAGCPTGLRLWLLGCFVAIFAGVAPANASDTGSGPMDGDGRTAIATALDGLPLPDRVTANSDRMTTAHGRVVVVEPGDSLWRIARGLLPAGASDADVAAAVSRLHAANRRTVGPDPDLLQPGQRLLVDRPDTHQEAP
jgi:hypothetical protein